MMRVASDNSISKSSECSYRSIDGTHTSKNTPKMPVPVHSLDQYGHLQFRGIPLTFKQFPLFLYLCVVGLFEE